MQTTRTGTPKFCVSVSAPRGNTTLSSLSSWDVVLLLWGETGKSSPGSTYSWKSLTTENQSKHTLETAAFQEAARSAIVWTRHFMKSYVRNRKRVTHLFTVYKCWQHIDYKAGHCNAQVSLGLTQKRHANLPGEPQASFSTNGHCKGKTRKNHVI